MKNYKVTAKGLNGATVNEIISAESEFDAGRIAAEKGLFVTNIKVDDGAALKKKQLKTKDLIIFSQQMYVLEKMIFKEQLEIFKRQSILLMT